MEERPPRLSVFARRKASFTQFFTQRSGLTTAIGLLIVAVAAWGLFGVDAATMQHDLLTQRSVVASDGAWIEAQLGKLAVAGSGEAIAVEDVAALVAETQRKLLSDTKLGVFSAAIAFAVVIAIALRSAMAGLFAALTIVAPIVMVFGALGWLGIEVGVGALMGIGLAIGLAASESLHFLTWFRRSIGEGLDRQLAVRQACDRCHPAIRQISLIGLVVLMAFATSAFAPMQQFGVVAIALLAANLANSFVVLPALLCGPLGQLIAPEAAAAPSEGKLVKLPANPPKPLKPVFVEEAAVAEAPVKQPAKPQAAEVVAAVIPAVATDDPLTPANAALRSKLQKFRRSPSRDAAS